jgi:DNA-binding MarR family transcriptional regulator
MGDSHSTIDGAVLRQLSSGLSAAEHIGLPSLICLLQIALDEGVSVSDLAERVRAPQQSVSRYVSILLGRYQNSVSPAPIEPLIEQRINSADPRKRSLHLTRAGAELVAGLARPVQTGGNYVSR